MTIQLVDEIKTQEIKEDMEQTKRLATLGYKRFPEHKGVVGA